MRGKKRLIRKTQNFVKVAVKKTHDVLEIAQLKLKLSQIKSKIEKKYISIGYAQYVKYRQNGAIDSKDLQFNDKIKKICSEIDYLFNKRNEIKEGLNEARKEFEEDTIFEDLDLNCRNCDETN